MIQYILETPNPFSDPETTRGKGSTVDYYVTQKPPTWQGRADHLHPGGKFKSKVKYILHTLLYDVRYRLSILGNK